MNNKGKKSVISYVIVVIILISAVIFMFYLLETEKKRLNSKPMTSESTTTKEVLASGETTTTTIAVDNNEGVTTAIMPEPVSNFSTSLTDIIGDLGFFGDYNVTTFYHGVEFTFKCNSYNEETGICDAGSALMKINDALYPVYTYTEPTGNYLLRGDDYYILLRDDLVMLYTSHSGVSAESARVFDLKGNQVGTIANTLTSYRLGDNVFKKLYPNIEDNNLYYYACENNSLVIKTLELGNYANQEIYESVEGTCY